MGRAARSPFREGRLTLPNPGSPTARGERAGCRRRCFLTVVAIRQRAIPVSALPPAACPVACVVVILCIGETLSAIPNAFSLLCYCDCSTVKI